MQYMCLIYDQEAAWDGATEEQKKAVFQEYMAFTEEVRKAGVMVAGDALEPTSTATTVHVEGGQVQTHDGPFAETKEQLGGYYLLECKDLDEALKWAAKIPATRHFGGKVEVRPVMNVG
jgi:hypothetical protein